MGEQKIADPEKNDLGNPDSLNLFLREVTATGHFMEHCLTFVDRERDTGQRHGGMAGGKMGN